MIKKILGISLVILLVVLIVAAESISFSIIGKAFHDLNNPSFRLLTTPYNKALLSGEDLIINSNIVKLGSVGRVDVSLEIEILDPSGQVYEKNLETFAIETQVNVVRDILIKENSIPGNYDINSKLFYRNKEVASSSSSFKVEEKAENFLNPLFITTSMVITLILLVISLIIFINHLRKHKKH